MLYRHIFVIDIFNISRDLSKNWCSLCNQLYSDDKQHLEAHRKDFLCRFCNCQLFTPESTIEHLLSHKGLEKIKIQVPLLLILSI